MFRAILGEGLVTFLFMFIVMATAVNNGRQTNPENLALAAISTAFASVALIYSFADVSGAHFNPAVTFATVITGKVSVRKGLAFIGIQLLASVFATLFQMAVFPGVGANNDVFDIPGFLVVDLNPQSNHINAILMEFSLTFILVYVIFATAFDTGNSNV
jgi:glycerol uptake facilitator-like aquaporin